MVVIVSKVWSTSPLVNTIMPMTEKFTIPQFKTLSQLELDMLSEEFTPSDRSIAIVIAYASSAKNEYFGNREYAELLN